jgi:hypothetical protein
MYVPTARSFVIAIATKTPTPAALSDAQPPLPSAHLEVILYAETRWNLLTFRGYRFGDLRGKQHSCMIAALTLRRRTPIKLPMTDAEPVRARVAVC